MYCNTEYVAICILFCYFLRFKYTKLIKLGTSVVYNCQLLSKYTEFLSYIAAFITGYTVEMYSNAVATYCSIAIFQILLLICYK